MPDPILSVGPHGPVPEERILLEVLAETVDALERANVPHLLMGGIASALVGRPRFTHDIDVFVRQHDSSRALEALEAAGFTTKVLGSYLLAEAVDRVSADLVLHGHAHRGGEKGVTPGGVHVRNVAQPVIRHAFNVYCLGPEEDVTPSVP